MGTERDGRGTPDDVTARRNVLKTVWGLLALGTVGAGPVGGEPDDEGGGPPDDDKKGPPDDDKKGPPDDDKKGPPDDDDGDDRTIEWEGQGSEHATQDCSGDVGYWHWVLTPGGSSEFEAVGELEVTFQDGSDQTVQGSQKGNGAYHFDVRKAGGGTVESASVEVTGGGRNALLTISDGDCEEADTLYWQVDFGAGEVKDPPTYWPDDLMAALGNSEDGVTENPSLRRQRTEGQLGDVDIDDNEFTFDDDADPSEVTVEFTVEAGGAARDLHLSSWVLPGEFDTDEIEEQERHDSTVANFEGGESGTLTIDIPQRD